jgi:hypothetical protein
MPFRSSARHHELHCLGVEASCDSRLIGMLSKNLVPFVPTGIEHQAVGVKLPFRNESNQADVVNVTDAEIKPPVSPGSSGEGDWTGRTHAVGPRRLLTGV